MAGKYEYLIVRKAVHVHDSPTILSVQIPVRLGYEMASARSRGIVSLFCKDQGLTGSPAENIIDVKRTENRS